MILAQRLQAALYLLNPNIPAEAIDEALRKITHPEAPSLVANNRGFHRMLIDGIPVEFRQPTGDSNAAPSPQLNLPSPLPSPLPKGEGANRKRRHEHFPLKPSPRPSPRGRGSKTETKAVSMKSLPISLSLWERVGERAYRRLPNQLTIFPLRLWRGGVGGGGAEHEGAEHGGVELPKHSGQIGVIWHTQGSGKSLTMAFYAGRIVLHPAMQNPTIVVITDRNDLDDQLFGTFSRCHELLRQRPVQAESRDDLQRKLQVALYGRASGLFSPITIVLAGMQARVFGLG